MPLSELRQAALPGAGRFYAVVVVSQIIRQALDGLDLFGRKEQAPRNADQGEAPISCTAG